MFALRTVALVMSVLLPVAFIATAGCGWLTDFGTLSSTVTDASVTTDPVDLSVDGFEACDTSYVNPDYSFGFGLDDAAVEAVQWSADDAALFAAGWEMASGDATILIVAQVLGTSYPANLALLVEAANEEITLAGGSISTVFDVILVSGDAAIQTNYVLDGTLAYRLDTVKNDHRYTLTVSTPQAGLTQTVDNDMSAAVASLCVD